MKGDESQEQELKAYFYFLSISILSWRMWLKSFYIVNTLVGNNINSYAAGSNGRGIDLFIQNIAISALKRVKLFCCDS